MQWFCPGKNLAIYGLATTRVSACMKTYARAHAFDLHTRVDTNAHAFYVLQACHVYLITDLYRSFSSKGKSYIQRGECMSYSHICSSVEGYIIKF